MYIKLDENNQIIATNILEQEGFIYVELPKDFDILAIHDYKYINNELVYSPIEAPNIEPGLSLEDRVASLEVAYDELLLEVLFGGE